MGLENRGTHAEIRQQTADYLKTGGDRQNSATYGFVPEENRANIAQAIATPGQYTELAEDAVTYAAFALGVRIEIIDETGASRYTYPVDQTEPDIVLARAKDHFFLRVREHS